MFPQAGMLFCKVRAEIVHRAPDTVRVCRTIRRRTHSKYPFERDAYVHTHPRSPDDARHDDIVHMIQMERFVAYARARNEKKTPLVPGPGEVLLHFKDGTSVLVPGRAEPAPESRLD